MFLKFISKNMTKLWELFILLLFGLLVLIFCSYLYINSYHEKFRDESSQLHANTDDRFRKKSENNMLQFRMKLSSDLDAAKVDGYLVENSKCRMQSLDPHDPVIMKFIKPEKFQPCSAEPILTSIEKKSDGNIYLIQSNDPETQYYTNLTCCWSNISRSAGNAKKGLDEDIHIGNCHNIDSYVKLPKYVQTIFVECYELFDWTNHDGEYQLDKDLVYENVHVIFNPKLVNDRLDALKSHTDIKESKIGQRALSVLMLGFDSISRLNFYRTMPKTKNYFTDKGWIELKGYNAISDDSFANTMAILAGQNFKTNSIEKCNPDVYYGLDNCSLIWYNFRDAGYVTAYAEDVVPNSTFNRQKVGFVNPPTDHYLRPYVLAAENILKNRVRYNAKYCTGPEATTDRIYDSAVDFVKTYFGHPYFGFFWTNGLSHEDINGPSTYDRRFMDKLLSMEEAGVMKESMIVVFSNHGMHFGEIRETFNGWYEERLPFIYIWIPEWFRKQYPGAYDALKLNQNRLTSPFDLHETLKDILDKSGTKITTSSDCPRCTSLFKQVSHERGCKDAGISPHWCTCSTLQPVSKSEEIVINGARKFVKHLNDIISQYKYENGRRKCTEWKLNRIIRVHKVIDFDENSDRKYPKLLYLLELSPGSAKFEMTIIFYSRDDIVVQDEEISRIDAYYQNATCLASGIKMYCQCLK